MSKGLRKVQKDRMPQWKLDSLIEKKMDIPDSIIPEPINVEREPVNPKPMLFGQSEFDTLHPDEVLRTFSCSIRDMLSRYDGNKEHLTELEQEMQDLLHYIELSNDKNANVGFKLYKRLAEVRRERRIMKNEIDLLQPIVDNFRDTDLLNVISRIQGSCKTIKQQIGGRAYTVRTDVLIPFIK